MFTVVILRLLRVFLRLAARKLLHTEGWFDDGCCFNTQHTTHECLGSSSAAKNPSSLCQGGAAAATKSSAGG
uniref:Putative secreted peptide n=1 Tax=Anopheles braziliensis TaxID=58242 RepID=A0A2M3ZVT4_9DIPT